MCAVSASLVACWLTAGVLRNYDLCNCAWLLVLADYSAEPERYDEILVFIPDGYFCDARFEYETTGSPPVSSDRYAYCARLETEESGLSDE